MFLLCDFSLDIFNFEIFNHSLRLVYQAQTSWFSIANIKEWFTIRATQYLFPAENPV